MLNKRALPQNFSTCQMGFPEATREELALGPDLAEAVAGPFLLVVASVDPSCLEASFLVVAPWIAAVVERPSSQVAVVAVAAAYALACPSVGPFAYQTVPFLAVQVVGPVEAACYSSSLDLALRPSSLQDYSSFPCLAVSGLHRAYFACVAVHQEALPFEVPCWKMELALVFRWLVLHC